MPSELIMPQQTDTMTEGTVVKWHKKEGDAVKAGEELLEIETDKATMPIEAPDAGVLAYVAVPEGRKVPVLTVLAVIAKAGEDAAAVKKQYASQQKPAATQPAPAPAKPAAAATPAPPPGSPPVPTKPAPGASAKPAPARGSFQYDLLVIGGGPAGYAGAIRAGQLGLKVVCVERAELGGTCLNWGCIPTKALLEDGAFIRKARLHAADHGLSFDGLKVDFRKVIDRSRAITLKLQRGIAALFSKYGVKHEAGTAQLLGPHRVRVAGKDGHKELTARHVLLAVGARATPFPGVPFDGKRVISSREAMVLSELPKRLAIIGGGAIGCEFADIYEALGSQVTIVEMLPHLLPIEDEEVSILLERAFARRGIDVRPGTKTDKVEVTDKGVKLTLSGAKPGVVEADVLLVAIGVTAATDGLLAEGCDLALDRKRVKVDPEYRTNLEDVWAVGDCCAIQWPEGSAMAGYRHPDLAHVAHHEAVLAVERIAGHAREAIDYRNIPGCTYTHPQVASMGSTEKKLREEGRELRVGKFPFSVSGRALAAGETDGFVKLIFDKKSGELLGVHMIGEHVTELLSELVVARKLEATEEEILDAIHPHPTLSEAVMEAAGVSVGKAIHL